MSNSRSLAVAGTTMAAIAFGIAAMTTAPSQASAAPGRLTCDDSLKADFQPDSLTTVVAVKAFRKGDPLILFGSPSPQTVRAEADLCMVKLVVGPGNPGPADAPSTSAGCGIEVWLPQPAAWNGRVHAFGGNGWSGGNAGSASRISNAMSSASVAATEGAVTSTSGSGHQGMPNPAFPDIPTSNGSFGMDPDGTLSKRQWEDFSWRSLEQQGLKTKALAAAYCGKAPHHSYFDGTSQGGREGHKIVQRLPDLYDGIVATAPAMHYSRFAMGWSDMVTWRDLGGVPLTEGQLDLVSNAAIHACDIVGGQHLGFILDYRGCRYDPIKDASVLCVSDSGRNGSDDCVTKVQANAINKLWYGPTADGSVPDPAVDNGFDTGIAGVRRWYGYSRGASLYNAALRKIFPILARMPKPPRDAPIPGGSDWVALVLVNPTMGGTMFKNASGDGQGLSRTLSYEQFANAFDRAHALQPVLAEVDADDPDLSAFKPAAARCSTSTARMTSRSRSRARSFITIG